MHFKLTQINIHSLNIYENIKQCSRNHGYISKYIVPSLKGLIV